MSSAAELADNFEAELERDFSASQPRVAYAPKNVFSEDQTPKEEHEAWENTAMTDHFFHEHERSLGSIPGLPDSVESLPYRLGSSGTDPVGRDGRIEQEYPLRSLDATPSTTSAEERWKQDQATLVKLPTMRVQGRSQFEGARRKAWTLSRGWKERPRAKQVEGEIVHENIRRWAAKQKHGRTRKPGFGQGISQRQPPNKWLMSPLYTAAKAQDRVRHPTKHKKSELITPFATRDGPGPRYNTRQNYPGRREDGRILDRPRTVDTTRVRDITFQSHWPDPHYHPMKTFGAENTYNPKEARPHQKTYELSKCAGRTMYNSIYYQSSIKGGPGPAHHVTKGFEALSRALPSKGPVSFGRGLDSRAVARQYERTRPLSPAKPEDYLTRGEIKHVLGPWLRAKSR